MDIDTAALRRRGSDVSLITYGGTLPAVLDEAAILASVAKTRRSVVVDEGWRSGSISAEICALIAERAFYELDAPVGRVYSAEVSIPYAKHAEFAALPSVERILAAAREVAGSNGLLPDAHIGSRHGPRQTGRMACQARGLCAPR